MKLGDIRLYALEVYQNGSLIFDDMSENLPDSLKDELVKAIELKNSKLKIEI